MKKNLVPWGYGQSEQFAVRSEAHSTTWNHQKHFIQVPVKSVRMFVNLGSTLISCPYWQPWKINPSDHVLCIELAGTIRSDKPLARNWVKGEGIRRNLEVYKLWSQYSKFLLWLLMVGVVVDDVIEGSRAPGSLVYILLPSLSSRTTLRCTEK